MDREGLLLHQVHPVKIGFDATASMVSAVLLWRRYPRAALIVHYAGPLIGSIVVLRWANVDRLRFRRAGSYVLDNMPPTAQAIRLAGDTVMVYAAWRRRPALVIAGLALVAAGWSYGLWSSLSPRHHGDRHGSTAAPGRSRVRIGGRVRVR